MHIQKATRRYEKWLGQHTKLSPSGLKLKHKAMAVDQFSFVRAIFYRWIELWPAVCIELGRAPQVLAIGDLHIANFGTWRDTEGRLVWGINDFDEAARLPFTQDLVRLATSALLAVSERHLSLSPRSICNSIIQGYRDGLDNGGRPVVLEEEHAWLRHIALGELRNPEGFWARICRMPSCAASVSPAIRRALESFLPQPGMKYRLVRRVAGLGSLGRQRVVALAHYRGGYIAREAKAMAPSAAFWASQQKGAGLLYSQILSHAVRCPDPFLRLCGNWLIRRISPDCSRIELDQIEKGGNELRLLYTMAWETANVHLGSEPEIKRVRRDLGQLHSNWLLAAAKQMSKVVHADWTEWRKSPSA